MSQKLKANLLRYWQESLLESNIDRLLKHQNTWWLGRDFEQIEDNPAQLLLNDKNLNQIISDFGEEIHLEDEEVVSLKLYISGIHLKKKDPNSLLGKVYFVIPYTIIFTKSSGGLYEFKKYIFPEYSKFNKDCLDPWGTLDRYIIGHSDNDEEFSNNNQPSLKEYDELITYASKHFEHVTEANFKDFINPNLRKNNYLNFFLTVEEHKDNINKHLHTTFEKINSDTNPNLMDLITNSNTDKFNSPITYDQKDYMVHSGQMDKSAPKSRLIFPIDPTQRAAIMSVLKMPKYSIQAINGPPGTGKTTMLQSVIASLWINFALEEKEPPIIVATASTNQAVTNVISSFDSVPEVGKNISLYSRWVPNISSYGWFIPSWSASEWSASEKPEFSNFQKIVFKRKWEFMDKPSKLFEIRANELEIQFLSCFHKSFQNDGIQTIKQAKEFIHSKLKDNVNIASTLIADFFTLKPILKQYSGDFLIKKEATIQLELEVLINEKKELTHENDTMLNQIQTLTTSISIIEKNLELFKSFKCKLELSKNTIWFMFLLALKIIKSIFLKQTILSRVNSLMFTLLFKRKTQVLEEFTQKIQILSKKKDEGLNTLHKLKCTHQELKFEENITRMDQQYQKLKEIKDFIIIHQIICERLSEINKTYRHKTQQKHYRVLQNILISTARTNEICIEEKMERTFFEYLDITIKATNFHIASRYWEACFVKGMVDQKLSQNSLSPIKMASYLGCCFVATLYTLPQIFLNKGGLSEKADLLIVDEAGQATPDTGVSLFYWAKKAVVVGDMKQIKPVSNMNESDDDYLCSRLNLSDQKNRLDYFGFLSSTGSLMALAQTCSFYKDKASPQGITLKYHYRCLPTIINFCNELLYNDELIPIRKETGNLFLPPMCYAYHNIPSTKAGSSWKNISEAENIADWLYQNATSMLDHYDLSENQLDECVAIVTPFKPQVQVIKNALEKKFMNRPTLLVVIKKSLVVGTAHSLQGAEKPIIIFSNTFFSKDKKESFIDRQPNILNVIISRAKDSLILFGHKDLFSEDIKSSLATKQLANYIVKHGSRLSPRSLVIVESPEKATTIEKYLKGRSVVIATKGHFVELIDVEIEKGKLRPIWATTTKGHTFISNMIEELKHCDTIYIATDSDREGEAIGWHIKRVFKEELRHKEIRRMTFYNIEEKEIIHSFENATESLDINIVKSAITRQIIDYIIGKKETEFLNKSLNNTFLEKISIGRVQAAYLDIINEYGNNTDIFTGKLSIDIKQGQHTLLLKPPDKYSSTSIFKEKSKLLKIKTELDALKNDTIKTTQQRTITKGQVTGCSDTMEIILEAYRQHNLMPWDTVEILQSLYESS
jgi:5S rRNA maturation endonuclease (ribonuclease M5)